MGCGVGQCLLVVAIMDSLLPRSIKVSSVAFWTQTERERRRERRVGGERWEYKKRRER